jgi:putative transposase
MLDGIELKGRMMIVALGITTEGVKIPLGLWEGSTENTPVATALLSDLVERGLDPEQGMLFVIDGSKGAARGGLLGVRRGASAALYPSKERNVMHHLPERDRPAGLTPRALVRRDSAVAAAADGRASLAADT